MLVLVLVLVLVLSYYCCCCWCFPITISGGIGIGVQKKKIKWCMKAICHQDAGAHNSYWLGGVDYFGGTHHLLPKVPSLAPLTFLHSYKRS